ncbi:MSC_0882 family membrane protein [Mycoplasma corogypsi]|uniref:MSC_0882 family membrane protein n=1 Tax=Mycoplasma corogypsi TaxID=2106 RepID=UPI003873C3A2
MPNENKDSSLYPTQTGTNGVNVINQTVPSNIGKTQLRIYQDPKNQLDPNLYTVIKREKRIKTISIIFWALLIVGCVIGAFLNWYLNVDFNFYELTKANFSQSVKQTKGLANYAWITILFIISIAFMIKNAIKLSSLKKNEQLIRQSRDKHDSTLPELRDAYRTLVLKGLRISWLYGFFMTYGGLILIIIAALYSQQKPWVVESQSPGFKFTFDLDFKPILENAFGNMTIFFSAYGSTIAGLSLLYVFVLFYDKKRIADIKTQIRNDVAFIDGTDALRIKENKAWRRTFIIIFVLVVLLPLALVLYLTYRGILKRKR